MRNVPAMVAPVGDHANRPVRAAILGRDADDSAAVDVCLLASKAWLRLDSLDQHLLQLLGGARWLGHVKSILPPSRLTPARHLARALPGSGARQPTLEAALREILERQGQAATHQAPTSDEAVSRRG